MIFFDLSLLKCMVRELQTYENILLHATNNKKKSIRKALCNAGYSMEL